MSNPSSSVNLAAAHRPRSFSTLTGQRHVVAVLRRAVQDDRVPQQILFSGGSGLGKTTVARILAGALLCSTPVSERVDGEVCGTCPSCVALNEDRHPDLIEFDAASNGGKDEIREIAARAQVTPMLSRHRVYIIDEAHGLSAPGGQAFLKLLEEPPAHVVFMLCTTDPQKMLKTNRGRCTEFELLPPSRNDLIANLERVCAAETWNCPTDVLEMVVDSTDPELGVRGTVNMLSKLSSLLAGGGAVTVDQAASLLGRASIDLTTRLFAAITSGSTTDAVEILGKLRQQSSEDAIRATLLDHARTAFTNGLANGFDPRRFRAFEDLVTLPKGRQWLDLYVYRLCAPVAFGADGQLAAPVARPSAESAGSAAPTSRASARTSAATVTPQNAPVTKRPPTEPAMTTLEGTKQDETKRQVAHQESRRAVSTGATSTQSSSTSSAEPGAAPSSTNAATLTPSQGFIAAVAKIDPDLAGTLRRCHVSIADAVTVTYEPALHNDLHAGQRILRQVAGRAGLPLQLISR